MSYVAAIEELSREIEADRAALTEKERTLRGLRSIQAKKQGTVMPGVIDSTPTSQLPLVTAVATNKTLAEAMREVIGKLNGQEFSMPVIDELLPTIGFHLGGKYGRSRISTTLEKFKNDGEIERTYTGAGSVPHRYKAITGGEKG
jgi:hypothetical protein